MAGLFLIQGSLEGPEIMAGWKLLALSKCKVNLVTQREPLAFEGPCKPFWVSFLARTAEKPQGETMSPVVGTVKNELTQEFCSIGPHTDCYSIVNIPFLLLSCRTESHCHRLC